MRDEEVVREKFDAYLANCFLCGLATSGLAGDPSMWPIELGYMGGYGATRTYHEGCVIKALAELPNVQSAPREDKKGGCAMTPLPWKWDGDDLWHFGESYNDSEDPHRYTGITCTRSLSNSPILAMNKKFLLSAVNHYAAFLSAPPVAREDKWVDVRQALEALVLKLELVHADDRYKSVWVHYLIHGGSYSGPKYSDELDAAKKALEGSATPVPKEPVGEEGLLSDFIAAAKTAVDYMEEENWHTFAIQPLRDALAKAEAKK